MGTDDQNETTEARVPVRKGRYEYVLVREDGTSTTIPVGEAAYGEGTLAVAVRAGEKIVEIGLSSTSDPDLDPPRGQLWPEEGR